MFDEETRAKFEAWRKRARTHLDLAERAANIGYWRYELTTNNYYWSPGMYRLLEEDPAKQAPDMEFLFSRMSPDDRQTIEQAVRTAIKTGSPFSYRTHAREPWRKAQIIDTQGEVERGEDGRTAVLLGVCHDVTEQVRAEEAREKAKAMYRLMTEESGDIIILYSTDAKMLFCSNALERLTGRIMADIEDGGYKRFVHPDDTDEASKMSCRPLDGDIVVATWRILHRDGHYVWLETTLRTVFDPATGEPRNVISVSRDITARREKEIEAKAARERAETANRAKSEFLANMSHELRTPLNAIIGFADLMRMATFGPLGNARYDDYALLIYDSGQLLLDLITDMLDMAKIEAGKFELNMERVDLEGTIRDVVRLLEERAFAAGVALGIEAGSAISGFVADRRAVKQIVINLLSNAIKFTPQGGQVRIAAGERDGFVWICVTDTGIGIPESEIARLGRPFEQVCRDPMQAKTGTGLGLALVRALAEKHGGALTIRSTEGAGTQVSVTFALTASARVAA